jgi:hypothetical protein
MISWLLLAPDWNGGIKIRLELPLMVALGAPAPNDLEDPGVEVPGLRVPPPPPAPGLGAAGGPPVFWKNALTNETGRSPGESGETSA